MIDAELVKENEKLRIENQVLMILLATLASGIEVGANYWRNCLFGPCEGAVFNIAEWWELGTNGRSF